MREDRGPLAQDGADQRAGRGQLSGFDALAAAAATPRGGGPGFRFAGPTGSFAPFSDLSTVVLSALTYLGLEIIPCS